MRFDLTGEQRQALDMVRSLARKSLAPKAAVIDEEALYPRENMERLAELGLRGMLVPESQIVISRAFLRQGVA